MRSWGIFSLHDAKFNARHFAVIQGHMGQDDNRSTSIPSNHVHRFLLDIALYVPRRLLKRDWTGEDGTRNRNLDDSPQEDVGAENVRGVDADHPRQLIQGEASCPFRSFISHNSIFIIKYYHRDCTSLTLIVCLCLSLQAGCGGSLSRSSQCGALTL